MGASVNVCVLAYHGLNTFSYGVALEIFAIGCGKNQPWYVCKTVAASPGRMNGTGGTHIEPHYGLDTLDGADIIVVPGWNDGKAEISVELKSKIQAAAARGVRLLSIGSGVFLLADCGVIGGKAVAVPPSLMQRFREKFPAIIVHKTSVYKVSDNIFTAAGPAAAIDMGLYVTKLDFGIKAANRVARRLVVPTYREGTQAQFTARAVSIHSSDHIGTILEELRENLAKDWDIDALAKFANSSPRTLQRRFKSATGFSPQAWLINERIELAKELLETTNLNIQQIADTTGLKSTETFRHHFKRIVGDNPTKFRLALKTDMPGKSA